MNQNLAPIDCAQFEEVLHDLDRLGTEGFALRESAFAHAESCSNCARLLTRSESLDLALCAIGAPESERAASSRVETALIEELRRRKAASSRLRVRGQVAALGVAAALLLALGLSLHRFSSVPKGTVATQGSGNPAASLSSATLASGKGEGGGLADSAAFIPLPYADDPAAVEDDAVVRVVLSRSALASLGLPVAETGGGETVSADLRVSEDGTPQAIRLVSQDSSEQPF
jgi:hypothetical protein